MRPEEVAARLAISPEAPLRSFLIPTGSTGLDLTIGGWPVGRVSELYGTPGCGKTTVALAAAREMQRMGTVAWVDLQNDFSPDYARACGVDLDQLVYLHELPYHAGAVHFWIVDSLSDHYQAMSLFWQQTTMLAVSQVRTAIGDPYRSTTGGYLGLRASTRVHLHTQGRKAVARVARCAYRRPPYADATFALLPSGIDSAGEVFDLAVQQGLVAAHSGHYYLAGDHIGHGRTAALEALRGRPGALQELRDAMLAAVAGS